MILESFSIVFITTIFIISLSINFIKNNYKENLVVIAITTLFLASYITFALNKMFIPIYFQILFL